MKRYLSMLFAVLFTQIAFGQLLNYQRAYPAVDRLLFNVSSAPTQGGGFYSLNVYIDAATFDVALHLSKHEQKGDLLWGRDFDFGETVTPFVNIDFYNMTTTVNDTVVIVFANGENIGGDDEKIAFKIAPDGEHVWSYSFKNSEDSNLPAVTIPDIIYDGTGRLNYLGNTGTDVFQGVHYSKIAEGDTSMSLSKTFISLDSDGLPVWSFLTAADAKVDSGIVFSTLIDTSGQAVGVVNLDSMGNVTSANQYSLDFIDYDMQVLEIVALPDSSTVQVGIVQDNTLDLLFGYVMMADSSGAVSWGRLLSALQLPAIHVPNSVTLSPSNEIVVTGKMINVVDFTTSDYAVFFDHNGNVLRQYLYTSDNSLFIDPFTGNAFFSGEINPAPDGGLLYSTVGFDIEENVFAPLIIKMDNQGAAFCEDTLDIEFASELLFQKDTLILMEMDLASMDTITVTVDTFDNYLVPILTLKDTVYCPQDPIAFLLDATLEDAVSYIWATGDTTPTLLVTEEGEYPVTVTLGSNVCFTLCDTAMITKRDFPEAGILPDLLAYCNDGFVDLTVASNNPVTEILWSTGETSQTIDVDIFTNYSVTVTDFCENTAVASISISEDDLPQPPEVSIVPDFIQFCANETVGLQAAFIPDPRLTYTIEWSTGDTQPLISVATFATYSVTVTDNCGGSSSASITVAPENVPQDIEITINTMCTDTSLQLQAVFDNTPLSTMWSTGEIGNAISVNDPGLYTITATNICGDEFEAERTVTDADIIACFDPCLEYPNVFIPTGQNINPENMMFGPVNKCTGFISNYELRVFDRWGTKVFESINPDNMWNGRVDSDLAPEGVYMFYSKYSVLEENYEVSGHVTLLRQ